MYINFSGNLNQESKKLITSEVEKRLSNLKIDTNFHIYFNLPVKNKLSPSEFNVLLLWEPQAVYPWQFRSDVLADFDLVVPFSPWRASHLQIENWVFHPYDFSHVNPASIKFVERDIYISMINAAKFGAGQTSNYGLRRKVIRKLFQEGIDIKLYGSDWNISRNMEIRKRFSAIRSSIVAGEKISISESLSSLFATYSMYSGQIPDKSSILSRSQLHLVIENDSDWVTEKIFDSFIHGAVPIYYGPEFKNFIPELEDCLIRIPSKEENIIKLVREISENVIVQKRRKISELLTNKPLINQFQKEQVWSKVGRIIAGRSHEKKCI